MCAQNSLIPSFHLFPNQGVKMDFQVVKKKPILKCPIDTLKLIYKERLVTTYHRSLYVPNKIIHGFDVAMTSK